MLLYLYQSAYNLIVAVASSFVILQILLGTLNGVAFHLEQIVQQTHMFQILTRIAACATVILS